MFDKAEVASSIEELRDLLGRTREQIAHLAQALPTETDPTERELTRQTKRAAWLEEYIPTRESEADE